MHGRSIQNNICLDINGLPRTVSMGCFVDCAGSKEEDKQQVKTKYESIKTEIKELMEGTKEIKKLIKKEAPTEDLFR